MQGNVERLYQKALGAFPSDDVEAGASTEFTFDFVKTLTVQGQIITAEDREQAFLRLRAQCAQVLLGAFLPVSSTSVKALPGSETKAEAETEVELSWRDLLPAAASVLNKSQSDQSVNSLARMAWSCLLQAKNALKVEQSPGDVTGNTKTGKALNIFNIINFIVGYGVGTPLTVTKLSHGVLNLWNTPVKRASAYTLATLACSVAVPVNVLQYIAGASASVKKTTPLGLLHNLLRAVLWMPQSLMVAGAFDGGLDSLKGGKFDVLKNASGPVKILANTASSSMMLAFSIFLGEAIENRVAYAAHLLRALFGDEYSLLELVRQAPQSCALNSSRLIPDVDVLDKPGLQTITAHARRIHYRGPEILLTGAGWGIMSWLGWNTGLDARGRDRAGEIWPTKLYKFPVLKQWETFLSTGKNWDDQLGPGTFWGAFTTSAAYGRFVPRGIVIWPQKFVDIFCKSPTGEKYPKTYRLAATLTGLAEPLTISALDGSKLNIPALVATCLGVLTANRQFLQDNTGVVKDGLVSIGNGVMCCVGALGDGMNRVAQGCGFINRPLRPAGPPRGVGKARGSDEDVPLLLTSQQHLSADSLSAEQALRQQTATVAKRQTKIALLQRTQTTAGVFAEKHGTAWMWWASVACTRWANSEWESAKHQAKVNRAAAVASAATP